MFLGLIKNRFEMKKILFLFRRLLILLLILFAGSHASGQTSISTIGSAVSMDFNSLTTSTTYQTWSNNSTLTGIYAKTDATSNITQYKANQGGNTVASLYSFGSTGASDRAIGYFPSDAYTGTSGSAKGYIGWRLKNNTGKSIGSIQVVWSGEQWRKAIDNNAQYITLSYQIGSSVTDLTSGTYILTSSQFESPIHNSGGAQTLDGNQSANRVANITLNVDVEIPDGSEIMLRWEDLNDPANHTLAIDDITFTATKEAQSITFDPLSDKTFGDSNFDLTATASSGLSVTYQSSNTSVATISGNTVTITGAGNTTITASQSGNTNYSAATPIQRVLTVKPQPPVATSASQIGPVNFTANWNAASGASAYYLYSSTDASFSVYDVASVGNVLNFTLSGSPSTTYYYRLKSITSGIYSDYSNPISVSTSPGVQVSNITSNPTAFGVTLDWTSGNLSSRAVFVKEGTGSITNPENYTRYFESTDWLIKGDQLGSSGYYCVYYGTGNSVILTNLSPGTQYSVQAFEFSGNEFEESYLTSVSGANNPITFYTLGIEWTGALSNDWNVPGNWSGNAVPGPASIVIIPNTPPYPVINQASTATSGSLTINSGASLTVAAGKALTVSGALINDGTLLLQSNATGTATLLMNSYSGTGTSNVELYLSGKPYDPDFDDSQWHYITPPVSSVAASVFTVNTLDLAQYVEDRPAGQLTEGWVAYDGYVYSSGLSNGPTFSTLTTGKGYNYWDNANQTYTMSGTLLTSNTALALSYGSNNLPGFNLLGNPYTAGLNWNDVINDVYFTFPANTSESLYFTRDNKSCSYINGVGVPSDVNGYIPPMQAFFVKTYSSGNTITLPAAARTHTVHARYKGSSDIPLVRLKLVMNKNNTDETVVRFDNQAKSDFDYKFDAYKMSSSTKMTLLYSQIGSTRYSINGQPFPDSFVEIPLTMNITKDTILTISAIGLQALENYNVTLKDLSNNFTVNLRTTSDYSFSASSGLLSGRFVLNVSLKTTGVENPVQTKNNFNIYSGNGNINIQTLVDEWDGKQGSVRILDLAGKIIAFEENTEFTRNSLVQVPIENRTGLYVVEIKSGVMRYTGKVVVK
jgi:hypothetical protein